MSRKRKTKTNDVRVLRRYTFKLYPNKAQEAALERQAQLCAVLWNAALEQRKMQWAHECQRNPKGECRGLSSFDQAKEVKHIRAAFPEIAAMSANTPAQVFEALDLAFQAFFRRVKQGVEPGYPQYKSTRIEAIRRKSTIWHRAVSGCALTAAGKHWRLYAKGVDGLIPARGRFPAAEVEHRDMRIIRQDGAWWLSIAVLIAPRHQPGPNKFEVTFDLIDEFARVKVRADGECLPGLEDGFPPSDEQISEVFQRDREEAPAVAGEMQADRRHDFDRCPFRDPAVAGEMQADRRKIIFHGRAIAPADAGDAIQSERDTRFKQGSWRWRKEKQRAARLKAREARQHKDALHRYTTQIIRSASELTVSAPEIREHTKSARGTERSPGAAVKTVAMLNRHVLAQAPAMAIQMFSYKAAEAGIPFARITPDEHALAIGRDLPAATKAARRAAKEIRKDP